MSLKTYKICSRCHGTGRFDRGTCFRCHGRPLMPATRKTSGTYIITGTEIATGAENVPGIKVQAADSFDALRAAKIAMRCAKVARFHEETMQAIKSD